MFLLCSSSRQRQKIAVVRKLVLAVLSGFLPAAPAPAEAAEPVSLYVNVVKDDKLIGGLGQANFRLYEDGQPRGVPPGGA
jgi:hypothetical protein